MKYLIHDILEHILKFRKIEVYSVSFFYKKSNSIMLYDPFKRKSIKYFKNFYNSEYNQLFFHVIDYKNEKLTEYMYIKLEKYWKTRNLVFYQKFLEPPNIQFTKLSNPDKLIDFLPIEMSNSLKLFWGM